LGEYNLVNYHDDKGAVVGICTMGQGTGHCVRDIAKAGDDEQPITVTGWPSTDYYYNITQEAEIGTRTMIATLNRGGLGCWDWTTLKPCTGGGYDAGGWLSAGLPSGYGAVWDGSCVVALGDPGLIFTANPSGSAPCTSLQTGTERRSLDLRAQRCDGTVGSASWALARLDDTKEGELTSAVVTISDAVTGEVLATKDLRTGPLDLSGIDPDAHPEITVDSTAEIAAGNPAWSDGAPPRVTVEWVSDPKQLCFTTTTPQRCEDGSARIGTHATLAGADASSEFSMSVTRSSSCPIVVPDVQPTPTPTPTPTPPPAPKVGPTSTDLVLGCTVRRIVLEDVVIRGGRVQFVGFADRKYAGSKVAIVFTATGKTVASPVVGADGRFSASAPLPPRKLRSTNRARYMAKVSKERSLALKLVRRMQVTSVRAAGGRITITGRVTKPFARSAAARRIRLERRVTCAKTERIATFMPKANGTFRITVNAPADQRAAVYRLHTKTRPTANSRKNFDTFTLPRAVDF
jgi:hypothetical protein